jgi:hypothetical protein
MPGSTPFTSLIMFSVWRKTIKAKKTAAKNTGTAESSIILTAKGKTAAAATDPADARFVK